jgi:hypothetical protein
MVNAEALAAHSRQPRGGWAELQDARLVTKLRWVPGSLRRFDDDPYGSLWTDLQTHHTTKRQRLSSEPPSIDFRPKPCHSTEGVFSGDDETCAFAGDLEADDGTRTHDLLHGKCEQPFAPVRDRSLKRPCAAVSVQPSKRVRTRANAEPCHPCHGFRRQKSAPAPNFVLAPRRRGGALLRPVLARLLGRDALVKSGATRVGSPALRKR